MLTDSEIKELIFSLLDCRKKLLWLIRQEPSNEKQKDLIEHAKELLIIANQMLEKDFYIELPS